jgi:hypothetical protein
LARRPDRPEQRRDKIDALLLYKHDQIADDGAGLTRVVRRIGDDRRAVSASQAQRIPQMFRFRSVKRLARNVAVGGRVHFRVEIAQPHVNPERCLTAAERAVAATPIERVPRQIEP